MVHGPQIAGTVERGSKEETGALWKSRETAAEGRTAKRHTFKRIKLYLKPVENSFPTRPFQHRHIAFLDSGRVFQYRARPRVSVFLVPGSRPLCANEKRARTWRHRTDRVRKFSACKRRETLVALSIKI